MFSSFAILSFAPPFALTVNAPAFIVFWTSWSCPPLTASLLPGAIVPSATLVILFPPALIPELFITTFPAPAGTVTLSKLTSLLVAIVKSFPAWVIAILSPSINLTVFPPSTFSAVPLLATTFHAAVSLIFCIPAGSKLSSLFVAALFILSFVACVKSNVTSSFVALDVKYVPSPLTLNLIPPVLSKDWVFVVPVSPPSEIVLLERVVTLFILSLASWVKSNVTSVPVAVDVKKLVSPLLIPNLIPPVWSRVWGVVDVLSPETVTVFLLNP